ncbi:ABC-type sugar transport system permease subunit [Arthrobacter pigmenti]|uniref:ABC-type sugar transport system permease subunit n=1 Tax=Arthrobacter pigmenti TaxID=271432 RepID=A0A846RZU3_9MICC|nr:sugar ABC transporter permease [Arthrobacter pigmenti]NJC24466.1 ABC-type sugar transport system permease subunit [Arthrobacter pigmenti]
MLSFARWDGFSPDWQWTGLSNYTDLLGGDIARSPQVVNAAAQTLVGMVVVPIAVPLIGLLLALLLNSIRRMRALMRTVYFLPYVTTGIAVFYAWRFMYEPNGAVNGILNAVGLDFLSQPDGFLGNVNTALGAVVVVQVWSAVPIAMLLYLTGLQTIPDSVIEAARIDGATSARTVWSIILPLLNPITALVVILQLREAFQNYQVYLLMTNGGPVDSTTTLGLLTYNYGFGAPSDFGYASALGWMLALAAVVLAIVSFRILRSRQ